MISKHFNRDEFKCKCGACIDTPIDKELIDVLEDVRVYFDTPVTITSGFRCRSHNKKEGGSFRSKHLIGMAADILVKGVSPKKVHNYLAEKYKDKYGIGDGSRRGFTHIDVRDIMARWSY